MSRGCAWIHGEPAGKATVFCGRRTVDGVWCAYHHSIVYLNAEHVAEPDGDDDARDEVEQLAVGAT